MPQLLLTHPEMNQLSFSSPFSGWSYSTLDPGAQDPSPVPVVEQGIGLSSYPLPAESRK